MSMDYHYLSDIITNCTAYNNFLTRRCSQNCPLLYCVRSITIHVIASRFSLMQYNGVQMILVIRTL